MTLRSGPATVLVAAGALVLALLPGSSACSTLGAMPQKPSIVLEPAPSVPGAEGTVQTDVDANGNTRVTVAVRHLAPPERLGSGSSNYVVWAKPVGEGPAQNLGVLRIDEDLRGTLEAITPMRSFELLITAENNPTTLTPSAARVLRAEIMASGR
jgi:hypothetical protein